MKIPLAVKRWKVLPDNHLELHIEKVMYMISDTDELVIVAEGMMQDVGRDTVSSWNAAGRKNWGYREGVGEVGLVNKIKRVVVDRESRECSTDCLKTVSLRQRMNQVL